MGKGRERDEEGHRERQKERKTPDRNMWEHRERRWQRERVCELMLG